MYYLIIYFSDSAIFLYLHSVDNTHTHTFNGPFSRTTRVGRYQKGKTNLDFAEARDSEWQWHHMAQALRPAQLTASKH